MPRSRRSPPTPMPARRWPRCFRISSCWSCRGSPNGRRSTGPSSTRCSAGCRTAPRRRSSRPCSPANPHIKFIDMSADFRLRDMTTYAHWYGHEHRALELQSEAVYGLTEFYRDDDRGGAARRLPRLLSDRGAAGAGAARRSRADRRRRHHHRRQVGRHRRRPRAEAEHAVQRSRRGALALFGRQAPPRAGDRAGDRPRGGRSRDR